MGIANETIKTKEIAPYSIKKLVPPLLLQCNDLESNDNTLQLYFSKDLIRAIASGLPKNIGGTTDLPLLGLSVAINKKVAAQKNEVFH